jgi:hypothetical protein
MIQHVTRDDFHAAFKAIRPDNFSFWGRDALFAYYEQMEDDIGEPITLDVIAICCDFTQYDSIGKYNEAYGTDYADWDALEDSGDTLVIRWHHPSGASWSEEAIVHNH